MLIETERIIITNFKQEDVYDLHEILGDAETIKNASWHIVLKRLRNFWMSFVL